MMDLTNDMKLNPQNQIYYYVGFPRHHWLEIAESQSAPFYYFSCWRIVVVVLNFIMFNYKSCNYRRVRMGDAIKGKDQIQTSLRSLARFDGALLYCTY